MKEDYDNDKDAHDAAGMEVLEDIMFPSIARAAGIEKSFNARSELSNKELDQMLDELKGTIHLY